MYNIYIYTYIYIHIYTSSFICRNGNFSMMSFATIPINFDWLNSYRRRLFVMVNECAPIAKDSNV